ncbi:MAG TPA: HDIG domain-containing protein, partial [Dehalococcoidia bacterium]|nr:HDIG domain-containing protein [Dehalococcoidia bacterium]
MLLLTALQVAVLFPVLPSRLHVHEGDIASQTIRAPRDFTYNSDVLRRAAQDQARRTVPDAFTYDVNVQSDQLAKLADVEGRISAARNDPSLTRPQLIDALANKGVALTPDQSAEIAAFSPAEWQQTENEATAVLGSVLQEPFSSADLTSILASLPNRVHQGLTPAQGDVAVALARGFVVPTEKVDDAATQQARDRAAAAVPPQPQSFARNQVIVREGDIIDAQKREALQYAGLLTVHLQYNEFSAVVLLMLFSSCMVAVFLKAFRPEVLTDLKRGLLLGLILAGAVLLAKVYMPQFLPDSPRNFLEYAFPAAAAPMLVASLFDTGLAVGMSGLIALLVTFTALYLPEVSGVVGLTGLQPLEMACAFFFGGLAGVLVVNRAERFNRFLLAGVAIAAATATVLFGFWLLEPVRQARDVGWLLLAAGLNGLASSLLTVGTFVLLGAVFNVSTRLQLMELAQLNQPLLRRLQEEAPGTFHHSILVGNLGERAADLIGADALLVRVGCYYHDIGKLSAPGYFVENQFSGENPHDALDPLASNTIVQEHVRYGQELARRYHLPERVRAFTTEHHGTRLVAYFYRKAAEKDPTIDPELFTYPGPRPLSRETAIAMLADSTEAIVRASPEHTPARIDELVESVIAERLAEGQFDDCDLTLRDLRTIAESFKQTLRAIYHPRVQYPPPTQAEQRRQGLLRAGQPEGAPSAARVDREPGVAAASTALAEPVDPSRLPEPAPAEPAARASASDRDDVRGEPARQAGAPASAPAGAPAREAVA